MMPTPEESHDRKPCLGIIMLDTRFPRIPGDVGNPDTFDFPVICRVVKGASPKRVVLDQDRSLLAPFIAAGQSLVDQGATLLTTSCGFLSLFHRELVAALSVPVVTSSLLLIPFVRTLLKPNEKIGVITARKASLGHAHLEAVGVQDPSSLVIVGMEEAAEFTGVFIHGRQTLDQDACRREMETAAGLLMETPRIGAVVLECTNMPPYADAVRKRTGKPVFDVTTLVNMAASAVA